MAESWGEDDEVIDTTMGGVDDWGVDDEEVVTPAPEPEGREGAFWWCHGYHGTSGP